MKIPLLIGYIIFSSVSDATLDSVDAYQRHLLRPEAIDRWTKEATRDCLKSSAECLPAYLSAKYSEAAMLVCRRVAGAPFEQQHGGTATHYAQRSIREACQGAIEACRSAWRRVDAINFRDSESRSDSRRVTHFEQFLVDTCGADPRVPAPF